MCTSPNKCYQNPDGGRPIFGWEGIKKGLPEMEVPCGKCPECCKDYYTSWATRGSRELSQWDSTVFITLTYDEENLPNDRSLKKTDVQKFIKRVKKFFRSSKENPIRQVYCGEYGKQTNRPHYHCILFNCDFRDKSRHYVSPGGHQVYTSPTLSKLWPFGNAEFGYAEPSSIAYLFKYILKKKSRKEKKKPYNIEHDGVTYDVEHEFIEASRNPGIGAWLRNSQSIRKGFLSVDGKKTKLPKYYLEHLKKNDLDSYHKISESKQDYMLSRPKESELRRKQKAAAQKALTDTKRKL